MNIFAISDDYHCGKNLMDKHIVKMPVETAQMLSTVLKRKHRRLYKPCFSKHPCTLWAGESWDNFIWLCGHGLSICAEYRNRYKRTHKSEAVIKAALLLAKKSDFAQLGLTPFAQAMPEEFKTFDNPVMNYRNYYVNGKAHIANWKRNKPDWYDTFNQETLKIKSK